MKKALIISVILHVITIALFGFKRLYYSHRPVAAGPAEWSVTWNAQKNELYSAIPIDSGDIVFVGDSHIERFLLNDYFPCHHVRNRGIGSNTTDQVIARLPDILQRHPSKVFVLVGINDLAMRRPVDSTFNNLVRITKMVKSSSATPVVILLFPSRGKDADLNDEALLLNNKLSSFCKENEITVIDIFNQLERGGQLNNELTSDDTHLNSKGYGILKDSIKKYLD